MTNVNIAMKQRWCAKFQVNYTEAVMQDASDEDRSDRTNHYQWPCDYNERGADAPASTAYLGWPRSNDSLLLVELRQSLVVYHVDSSISNAFLVFVPWLYNKSRYCQQCKCDRNKRFHEIAMNCDACVLSFASPNVDHFWQIILWLMLHWLHCKFFICYIWIVLWSIWLFSMLSCLFFAFFASRSRVSANNL